MSAWTQEDVDRHNAKLGAKMPAHVAVPQKSKYKNVRVQVDGVTFDSKREAAFWQQLKLREKAGEISELTRQGGFALHCPNHAEHLYLEVCEYRADFRWRDSRDGKIHVADAKGVRTQIYKLKAKWMELEHGIVVEEV